jgi:hypothetical protein
VRYDSGRLTGCGEIARAGEQHFGPADHGTVTVTVTYRQANRHAERHVRRLLAGRQLPDRRGICPQSMQRTWTGPSVLTPYYPQLLVVSAAGDFEGYLSFGIGLAAQGSYHVFTLTSPDRVVIDVSHVALGTFPGIWNITRWSQYWAMQYSWLNGHQPWLASPLMVVQAWASSRWQTTAPVVRQVNTSTFKVTEPSGKTDTVTGTRPASVPGPWVITKITYG